MVMSFRGACGRLAVVGALAGVLITACGADRPSVDDWQSGWESIVASIPGEASVSAGELPPSVCSETLVFLRAHRSTVLPTPDLAIDEAVTSWIEIAEAAFFECPPHNDQFTDFAGAYAELSRLEAEIQLVLELDRAG